MGKDWIRFSCNLSCLSMFKRLGVGGRIERSMRIARHRGRAYNGETVAFRPRWMPPSRRHWPLVGPS